MMLFTDYENREMEKYYLSISEKYIFLSIPLLLKLHKHWGRE